MLTAFILCTVYFGFPSVLTLLLAVESTLSFARDTKKQTAKNAGSEVSAQFSEDGLTRLVLATCTAICLVCLHCLRVVWPRKLRRKCHSMVSIVIARVDDVDYMAGVVDYGFDIVAGAMIAPHMLFLVSVARYVHRSPSRSDSW